MSVITIEEARTHLNITNTTQDAELGTFVAAAEAAIVNRVGPLVSTPVARRVSGGASLVLPIYPARSLTSITPSGGTALALDGISVGTDGIVSGSYCFTAAQYDVAYVAGHAADAASLPADLRLAVLEMVRHLWSSQRGPSARPGSPGSDALSNTLPGAAYAWPIRVEQLIAPYEQPGVA